MNDRPRSEKDTVPDFQSGEEALEYMERKLNGSWVDQVDSGSEVPEVERAALLNSDTLSMDDFNKLMGF